MAVTEYLMLFYEFFKTGLFAVGGGLATLPFLYDISSGRGWFSFDDIADMIAVSESTPGPIGVNMATYAGFVTSGIVGSLCAVAGLIAPPIIITLIIAKLLDKYRNARLVDEAFYGLRSASAALIATACVGVALTCLVNIDAFKLTGSLTALFDIKAIIFAAILFVAIRLLKKVHPAVFIGIAAVAGILIGF